MLGDKDVSKVVLLKPPTDEQKAFFEKDFGFFGCEVILKGYSKSRGIEFVEKYCGVPHEGTVAIGDTSGDIDMTTYAEFGISMGNGSDILKSRVKYVTKSCSDDGVAYAINCLLEGNVSLLEKD